MGKKIQFVDQTIRDAQQSLWGFLMSTEMITPIAPIMDEVGYKVVATVGGNGYVVQSRYYGEDPWERIRLVSRALSRTPMRGSYMTASLASFDVDTPRDVIALWIRRSVANGVKGFWICDYQNDTESFYHFGKLAKELGAEVVTSLMYTSSPAHDAAHWAKKTRQIAELKEYVDSIMIEDASGVLTPESTRGFLATVKEHCDGIPLEFHMHCNSGLAPLCYLEAIRMGVETVHTAVAPLANGTSLPSTESILRNARRLGYAADVDEGALEAVSSHFRKIAEERGFPIGTPEEYDLFHYEHQVPGGMRSNLKRQLKELGMEHRLDEVLEEVVHVRRDLGYPVMATPFSQIVGVQAVENVVSGERYQRVPDTVVKYVMGFYGEPAAPIDPNVRDRILELPEAKKLREWQPTNRYRPLEELRREVGPELTDDELLLRILIPGRSAAAGKAKARPPSAPPVAKGQPALPSAFPMAFEVEVDGEVFDVKITPAGETAAAPSPGSPEPRKTKSDSPGAVVAGMGGMVVSIKARLGEKVNPGDPIATIEAMKMLRDVAAPHGGVVEEILVSDGDMVDPEHVLMVVGLP
ncbi:MAG: pyruvate carboxylase subunit B [Deltaproteobacteria bacterium]|nr:pyruvate carboxylase subunit B [Deltaproteobacteria bacterium]